MSEKAYPLPASVEVTLLTGSGTGPLTMVPAVSDKIGVVWAIQQVLSSATGQTIKSGSTTIDALPTSGTRVFEMPVGDLVNHSRVPFWQGNAVNEALTIQFASSVTYSLKVYYTYVSPNQ